MQRDEAEYDRRIGSCVRQLCSVSPSEIYLRDYINATAQLDSFSNPEPMTRLHQSLSTLITVLQSVENDIKTSLYEFNKRVAKV